MGRTPFGIVATAALVLALNGCTVGDPPYSYPSQGLYSDGGTGAASQDAGATPPPAARDAGPPTPSPTGQDAGTPAPPPTSQDAGTPTPPPPPVCGNGIVEAGEQCDDGNTVSGDGCSSTCQLEVTPSCGATETLSGNVQPIFTSGCASFGCHASLLPQRGINLSSGSSYGSLVGVSSACGAKPYVDPGNPSNSYLLDVLSGSGLCSGDRKMPASGSITQAQVAAIITWICEGAQNN